MKGLTPEIIFVIFVLLILILIAFMFILKSIFSAMAEGAKERHGKIKLSILIVFAIFVVTFSTKLMFIVFKA